MTLATFSILLGIVSAAANGYVFLNPGIAQKLAPRFPRNLPLGYVLMGLATVWFLYNLNLEQTDDFLALKKPMMIGFGAVGIMTCIYVTDFLPVRGLAISLMLLAKYVLDLSRWADTQWRLMFSVWAYVMILAGMWWTISPWRLRDLINWAVADLQRLKLFAGIKAGFGLLLIILGLTVFRGA